MKTLSVCMIVKDEEETLPLVLSDAKRFADEIVLVDTGSSDRSKEIAARFTDRILDFEWIDDFSAARNFSLQNAGSDYLMWLDADDRVPAESADALRALKAELDDEDVVMLPYETAFDAEGATFCYFRERIFKNGAGFRFSDPVHETVVPRGKIVFREIPIEHRKVKVSPPDRNLNVYRKTLAEGKTLNARQKYYYANELVRNGFFEEARLEYEAFLALPGGMKENRRSARLSLARLENSPKRAAEILLSGFYDAPPDAETLVELGHNFVREERFSEAIPYYLAALNAPPASPFAFRNKDMEVYIPALQLALCHYRLNDRENALKFNALALAAKPEGELALKNQLFYEKMPGA